MRSVAVYLNDIFYDKRSEMFFNDIVAWRFIGSVLWSVVITLLAEIAVASSLSLLSANDAFGFFGLRGLILLGLQLLVQVRGR